MLDGHMVVPLPRDYDIDDANKFGTQAAGVSAGIVPTKNGFGIRHLVQNETRIKAILNPELAKFCGGALMAATEATGAMKYTISNIPR